MAPALIEQAVLQVRLINGSRGGAWEQKPSMEVQGSQEVDLRFADQDTGDTKEVSIMLLTFHLRQGLRKKCFTKHGYIQRLKHI